MMKEKSPNLILLVVNPDGRLRELEKNRFVSLWTAGSAIAELNEQSGATAANISLCICLVPLYFFLSFLELLNGRVSKWLRPRSSSGSFTNKPLLLFYCHQ